MMGIQRHGCWCRPAGAAGLDTFAPDGLGSEVMAKKTALLAECTPGVRSRRIDAVLIRHGNTRRYLPTYLGT